MLYDPKWEQTKEAEGATEEQFVAWLEKQPADKSYNYTDCDGGCLIDLFFGRKSSGEEYKVLNNMAVGNTYLGRIACGHPRTFGGALARVREAQCF